MCKNIYAEQNDLTPGAKRREEIIAGLLTQYQYYVRGRRHFRGEYVG